MNLFRLVIPFLTIGPLFLFCFPFVCAYVIKNKVSFGSSTSSSDSSSSSTSGSTTYSSGKSTPKNSDLGLDFKIVSFKVIRFV